MLEGNEQEVKQDVDEHPHTHNKGGPSTPQGGWLCVINPGSLEGQL